MFSPSDVGDGPLMASVGNGNLAWRVGRDEFFVAGLFNGPAIGEDVVSHRAGVPALLNVTLAASSVSNVDIPLVASGSALSLADGVFMRRFQSKNRSGPRVHIEQMYYAHHALPHLLVFRLRWWNSTAHTRFHLHGLGSSRDDKGRPSGSRLENLEQHGLSSLQPLLVEARSRKSHSGRAGGDPSPQPSPSPFQPPDIHFHQLPCPESVRGTDCIVLNGSTSVAETASMGLLQVALVCSGTNQTLTVDESGSGSVECYCAVHTSLDAIDPLKAAIASFAAAVESDPHLIFEEHKQSWGRLRDRGVFVDYLPLAQAVNASQYYILSSVRDGPPAAPGRPWPFTLSPGGLASNSYNGHTFWDSETWMVPNLCVFQPSLAKAALRYRCERLNEAYAKARSYPHGGYRGAMFPWESALSGAEVCPLEADTGLFEQHISGDIAVSLWTYWTTSGDIEFVLAEALPVLQGIADFWSSRATENADGSFSIVGVIPPDEYAENVTDSVFTNTVASIALRIAINATRLANQPADPLWEAVAARLRILFDPELHIHPEYAGYAGGEIKQADVILLGYPLGIALNATVRANDLKYYGPRTDRNGPAMTWSMQAIGYLEVGLHQEASKYFVQGYSNIQAPFNVWTETPQGGAVNFITGAGGFLQSVWAGYFGIRYQFPEDDGDATIFSLRARPSVPANVTRFALRGLRLGGNQFDLLSEVQNDQLFTSVTWREASANIETFKVLLHSGFTNKSLHVNDTIVVQGQVDLWIQAFINF